MGAGRHEERRGLEPQLRNCKAPESPGLRKEWMNDEFMDVHLVSSFFIMLQSIELHQNN